MFNEMRPPHSNQDTLTRLDILPNIPHSMGKHEKPLVSFSMSGTVSRDSMLAHMFCKL